MPWKKGTKHPTKPPELATQLATLAPEIAQDVLEYDDLTDMFATSLKASRKSPRTIATYLEALTLLRDYLVRAGMPVAPEHIRREHIEAFFAALAVTPTRRGNMPTGNTIVNRYRSLHAFFSWCVHMDELKVSPMLRMSPPKKGKAPPKVIPQDRIDDLLATFSGKGFDDRRDKALLMFLLDTGVRRDEIARIQVDDIDWQSQFVTVHGKGEKDRGVPFGDQTALALRSYLRVRRAHKYHELPALWLGRWGALTSEGVYQVVKRRSEQAGIGHTWVHLFRHTWAHHFKASGGSFEDLKILGGWEDDAMPLWYGSSEAAERAKKAGRQHSVMDRMMKDKKP